MKAFILAAGRGSRLLTLTDDRPKCWVELKGRPLIEWQLHTLRRAGIEDITIVRGYLGETFDCLDVALTDNPDWESTNMVESLFCAEATFGDDILVCYADIAYEPRLLDAIANSDAPCSVLADRAWESYWSRRFDDPLSDAETFRTDDTGRIVEIGRKPDRLSEIEGQYVGLLRFRDAGIDQLRAAREALFRRTGTWMGERPAAKAYMTDILLQMIGMGHPPVAVDVRGGWVEVDTPSDLALAEAVTQPTVDGTLEIADERRPDAAT